MTDHLTKFEIYQQTRKLWKNCWMDLEIVSNDYRGKEIGRQLIRSTGSICANIEEGYGRGFGKDYRLFLSYARGSARESKGWYERLEFLLPHEVIKERVAVLDQIIGVLSIRIENLK